VAQTNPRGKEDEIDSAGACLADCCLARLIRAAHSLARTPPRDTPRPVESGRRTLAWLASRAEVAEWQLAGHSCANSWRRKWAHSMRVMRFQWTAFRGTCRVDSGGWTLDIRHWRVTRTREVGVWPGDNGWWAALRCGRGARVGGVRAEGASGRSLGSEAEG